MAVQDIDAALGVGHRRWSWRIPPARSVRRTALVAYAVLFLVVCGRWGLPLDRELVLLWVGGALLCVSIGRPVRTIPRLVADWLPFAAILFVYDLSRGAADTLGAPVHYTPQLEADRWLFGGVVPTVWLQDRLVDPDHARWYEASFSLVYATHFIVPFVVAAVFWVRDRDRFLGWAKRFVTLSFVGVATYIAFPAAPPWLAATKGYLPDVVRSTGRGFAVMHLSIAERVLERGQATVNVVAAVPSLHAAFAALVAMTLWPGRSRPVRAVLLGYVLAMGFALTVTAEHYVVDVLLGWIYAAGVMLVWQRIDARRASRLRDGATESGIVPSPSRV